MRLLGSKLEHEDILFSRLEKLNLLLTTWSLSFVKLGVSRICELKPWHRAWKMHVFPSGRYFHGQNRDKIDENGRRKRSFPPRDGPFISPIHIHLRRMKEPVMFIFWIPARDLKVFFFLFELWFAAMSRKLFRGRPQGSEVFSYSGTSLSLDRGRNEIRVGQRPKIWKKK